MIGRISRAGNLFSRDELHAIVPRMPRYEFSEGSSNKFWEITLNGTAFTTTWGKIGTPGTSTTKSWKDAATAQKEYDKLVAEKTKKGYVPVNGGAGAQTPAAPAAAPAPAKKAAAKASAKPVGNSEALAKRIDDDPNDAEAWAVYADFLQSQGDPRGELAMVQEQLLANPKDKALLSAEKKLLKEHAETLIGPLAKYMGRPIAGITVRATPGPEARSVNGEEEPIDVRWRAGHFVGATVGYGGYDWFSPGGDYEDDGVEDFERDVAKMLADLLDHPAARFLTNLRLGMPNNPEDGECDSAEVIKALVAKGDACSRLRTLYIGDIAQEESEVSWIHHGDLSKLWPKTPNLQSLTIRGGSFKLGAINLPELRELIIVTGGLDKANLASICKAKWPKLEKLEVWTGSKSYGANSALKDVQPLLDGAAFPALKTLGIKNCEYVEELCKVLPGAKILPRLEAVDLAKGVMTMTGVKALAEKKDAFAHLVRMDLSDNYLDQAAQKLAATITRQVRTKPQREPSEWDGQQHRYVALGE